MPGTYVPHIETSGSVAAWYRSHLGSLAVGFRGLPGCHIEALWHLGTSHLTSGIEKCRFCDVFDVTKRGESIANNRVSWQCGCVAARWLKSWILVISGDPPQPGKGDQFDQMASRAEVSYILVPGWQAARYLCTPHRAILAAWQRLWRLAGVPHGCIVASGHLTSHFGHRKMLISLRVWRHET